MDSGAERPADGTASSGAGPEKSEDTTASAGPVGEPEGVTAAALAAEVAELKAELARTREQAEERMNAWRRAQADYENLTRRSAAEVNERSAQATGTLLMEFLPIVDNFERAFRADRHEAPDAWAEGIQLIEKEVVQFLERLGVQPIATEGQVFDPNYHEAVSQAPGPDNEVVEQVRKGYLLGARVLRPAMVVVGQGEPAGASDAAENEQ